MKNKKQLRFSCFCHIFKKGNAVCLYHSLSMKPVYTTSIEYDKICQFLQGRNVNYSENLLKILVKNNLVVPVDYVEINYLELIRKTIFKGPHFSVLFLMVTDICNLRCKYCFIEDGKIEGYTNSVMTEDIGCKAIDLFIKNRDGGENASITFYGGEPLLAIDIIFRLLIYIDSKIKAGLLPKNTDKVIITNGTLIEKINTEELLKLKKSKTKIFVSLDGPQKIHDDMRVYVSGKGTFKDVIKGINILQNQGFDIGFSCTVADHNLNVLPEIVKWMFYRFNIRRIGFNCLEENLQGRKYPENYAQRYSEAIIKCRKFCEEKNIYEERFMRKLKQFIKQEIYLYDCAACGSQLTISPDGKVGVCHGFLGTKDYFSGNVYDKNYNPKNDENFIEWSNRSPLNMVQCVDCFALGICGGGCPRNALLQKGSIWGTDDIFCTHTKMTLEWLIWDLLKKSKKDKTFKL
jgi:uncharacterized protein